MDEDGGEVGAGVGEGGGAAGGEGPEEGLAIHVSFVGYSLDGKIYLVF